MSALDAESQALDQFETAVLKRDRQSKEVDRLSIQHDEALEQLEAAKAAFEHAEQDLTEIQALHIARKLKPGEPCPACGALNHPDPASGDPERRGRHDEFERAGKILRSAENDELEARTTLAAAKATLVERQNEVDALERPKRDRVALAPILLAAREEKTALEADNRFADLEGEISSAEAFASNAAQALENAKSAESDAKGVEVRAQTAYDTTLKGVPDELRPVNALSEALSAAIAKHDELAADHEAAVADEKDAAVVFSAAEEAAKIAQNGVAKTSEGLKKAQGEFFGQLEKVGLSEEAFQAAKDDVAQYSVLEAQISDYENRVAAITARLRGLTEDIGDQPTPDLSLLTKARNEARAALEQSRDAQSRLKNELDGRQQVLGQVQRLTTQINDLEKEYGPVGGLSDLVNGNNDRKVRLPDFAIAAMFDEVLLAANHRLGPMTEGRYQLMRPEVTGGGRQKQGLEISVFDGNTEKSRPTKTLSGGEGFQASLALALGLSDVVQRNSGGIKLDAIFIDEGFGTLDEDTLNTALETLYDLTNDMRSVGLISHTEQVKTMITEGFDIEITPTGSHIHPRRNAA
jgi:exonuclease SbcC